MKSRFIHLISAVALAIGAVGLLIATVSASAPSPERDVSNSVLSPTDRVTIRWLAQSGAAVPLAAMEQVVADFNASQSTISLTLETVPSADAQQTLQAQIDAGDPPDIVGSFGVLFYGSFHGQWLDLSPIIASTGYTLTDYYTKPLDLYREDGELLGLPLILYPSFVFYNADLFDSAELAYPPHQYGQPYTDTVYGGAWTTDKLAEVARLLTLDDSGNTAFSPTFDADNIMQFGYLEQWMGTRGEATLFGADSFVDANGDAQIPADWRTAFHWYYDAMWGSQPFIPNDSYIGSNQFGNGNPFNSGHVAMAHAHQWYLCCLPSVANWDIAATPAYSGVTTSKMHTDGLRIIAATEHPTEAFQALTYLVGDGASTLLDGVTNAFPARISLQSDALDDLEAAYPGVDWQVLVDSIDYTDDPNHQGYMPNLQVAENRIDQFGRLYHGTAGLDIDAELDILREDLQAIFNYPFKTVTPQGEVKPGDRLTYTVYLSATPGTQLGFYDPLTDTTFVSFVEQPTGIVHDDDAITGTLTVTPTWFATVTFVVQVDVPLAPGVVNVVNRACVYALPGTLDACQWTNRATVASRIQAPEMRVNYGHDWVGGDYQADHTLWITVTDSVGAVKATAAVSSTSDGGWGGDGFETRWEDWSPQQPDIAPGDRVNFWADNGYTNVITVGIVGGRVDVASDSISGTITAAWFTQTLDVECHPWGGPHTAPDKSSTAAPDGSTPYFCQWNPVTEWDVLPGQDVAAMYVEPDGDRVFNVFQAPAIRINYGHDWVEADYEAGHTVWITLTDSGGAVKATAVLTTGAVPWWGGRTGFSTNWQDWTPSDPDLVAGDWVSVRVDDSYSNTVHIGIIDGNLDVVANTVSGTITAAGFTQTLDMACEVWVENGPDGIWKTVEPDGGSYLCDFDDVGWDLEPGQEVAVSYFEPDNDRVYNMFRESVPHLRIRKDADHDPGEDSNFVFRIEYWNDGDGAAENVVITDTMDGMTYLTDTSGLSHTGSGSGPIVWDLGTVPAHTWGWFDVFVYVTAVESETVANTAQIATSNPFDEGDAEDKESTWSGHVEANDTHLDVGKWAWTSDPTPGRDFVYSVDVCNNGSTASDQIILTDTLHLSTTLQYWWARDPGWAEVSSDDHTLVLSRPALPGYQCGEVYLRVYLADAASPGDWISNTAVISASNDLEGDDNETTWWGQANSPHTNLYIRKQLEWGELVPGGEIAYDISYRNDGNVPVDHVLITDTLPANTAFNRSWLWTADDEQVVTPTVIAADYVVWDIGTLDNGYGWDMGVALDVSSGASSSAVLTNTVEISPQPNEDRYDDNSSTVVETLNGYGPNLRVSKYYDWEDDGRRLRYGIWIRNVGTTRMENIWITDTYPISTTSDYDSFWIGHGPWYTHTHDAANRQFVVWAETLDPGETGHFGFRVDLDGSLHGVEGLVFTNTVEAPWPGDIYPADNTAVEVAYTGPDVYVEKWLSGGEPEAGALVTFTVEFGNRNQGPWNGDSGYGSHITETLPTGMRFITATYPWQPDEPWVPESIDGNTIVWSWDPMWSGWAWQFDVVAQITDTTKIGEVFTNTVTARGDSPDEIEPYYQNNSFSAVIALPKYDVYLPLVFKDYP